jgi:hypothetical protein
MVDSVESVASPEPASVPPSPLAASPIELSPQEAAAANPVVRSGAQWFWWIIGLSLVNMLIFLSGSTMNFVVGLGITTLSDAIFANNKIIGFTIDAVALGFFAFVGFKAQNGRLWAFYLGLAVYTLDALLYVLLQVWMSVAFHALAIFYIGKGAIALRSALKPPKQITG